MKISNVWIIHQGPVGPFLFPVSGNIRREFEIEPTVTHSPDPQIDTEARLEAGFGTVARAQNLVEPLMADLGYDLVRLQMSGNERPKLQVMIERLDGAGLGVEDCVSASRAISALMDVEDPIESTYDLEVTSPGVDRPLTRMKDFVRFEGYEAKLETQTAYTVEASGDQPGRLQRRFHGRLAGVEGNEVLLQSAPVKKGEDGPILGFEFTDLQRAKLVITDDLMDDAKNGLLPGINAGLEPDTEQAG